MTQNWKNGQPKESRIGPECASVGLLVLKTPTTSKKEIQQIIDEGEQRGLISEDEGEMIQGIFSFRDTIAREDHESREPIRFMPRL